LEEIVKYRLEMQEVGDRLRIVFLFAVVCLLGTRCTTPDKEVVPDPREVDPALVSLLTTRANEILGNHLEGIEAKPTRVHLVLQDKEGWSEASSTASSMHTALKFAARELLMILSGERALNSTSLKQMALVVTIFFQGSHIDVGLRDKIDSFNPKRDGLVIRKGHREWVFSPYKPPSKSKDIQIFFASACEKAAFSKECFKDESYSFYRYPTMIIHKEGILLGLTNDLPTKLP
jgi:hypothetical protein